MPLHLARAVLPLLAALNGCLPGSITGPEVPVFPDGTTRILFVGNSLTYVEDVPSRVVQIAQQYGDTSVRVAMIAAPDFALIDHWNAGDVVSALKRGRWEFVVMQQGPSSLPENQLLLRQWSTLFVPSILAAGGRPVMYGVWPHRLRASDMLAVETSYFNAARDINGEFAPAGSAWYRALALDPTLPLYSADGLHAAPLGAYLSALVIACRVLGRDPLTLPPSAPGLSTDSATIRMLQRVAAEVLRDLDTTPDKTLIAASPGTAREAWQLALGAQRRGALDTAYRAAVTASDTWPVQPAYARGAARLAQQVGDTAGLRRMTQRVTRLAGVPAGDRSMALVLSADTTVFPEGLAADPRRGTLYVSSLAHRAIYERSMGGRWRRLLGGPDSDLLPPVAIAVDTTNDLLVVATGAAVRTDSASRRGISELLLARLSDGSLVARVPLGDGRVIPGDIALLPDGTVVVSDATAGALMLWNRRDAAMRRVSHPWLRSPQGMVATSDGRVLYVADWSSGLLRVVLESGRVERLAEPDGATLVGIDGLVSVASHDGSVTLIGVQNGVSPARIVSVELTATGHGVRSIRELDRPQGLRGEPTIGAMLGGTYWYVSSSHWPFRDADGARTQPEIPLPPVEVRCLSLTQHSPPACPNSVP